MPPQLTNLIEKLTGAGFLPRIKQFAFGLAEDFWKDGGASSASSLSPQTAAPSSFAASMQQAAAAPIASTTPVEKKIWHAEPGEILEKMWGDGFIVPGDAELLDALLEPVKLTKDMSVLDLSAGLGGRPRLITGKYGASVSGLDPDPEIAARGMELAIQAGKGKADPIATYDPSNFSLAKKYDCIVARDVFYRIQDKNTFFAAIAGCTQAKAHIAFTDYILNPEDREKPAVMKWQGYEKNMGPLSLVEMAEGWAKVGFTLSVHEDQTPFYRKQVTAGLHRLAVFLAGNIKPDPDTKKDILANIQTWVHRLAALEQGVKFYRFYGNKH